jgi:hypothetical protein
VRRPDNRAQLEHWGFLNNSSLVHEVSTPRRHLRYLVAALSAQWRVRLIHSVDPSGGVGEPKHPTSGKLTRAVVTLLGTFGSQVVVG